MVKIILIEKGGNLKQANVRGLKKHELYKKCGYKTDKDFEERACWNVKIDGVSHSIKCFAKDDGRANMENKYDLPPPIDTKLYFGTVLLTKMANDEFEDLSLELWEKVYEKLFGGFEDLSKTAEQDENEVDELQEVPKEMKTKNGYLKDGFVVDSDSDEDEDDLDDNSENSWCDDGSELGYEEYEYSDEDE